MEDQLYYAAFRVAGECSGDSDVRLSAWVDRVTVDVEPVGTGRHFAFDLRAGDAGCMAMKLLEAMSAVNRERATRMVRAERDAARERGES